MGRIRTFVVADEYLDELIRQEYMDGYIERNNAEIREYSDDSEYKAQMQQLRRENMLNLYINSKDYKGETIVIERDPVRRMK